MRAGQRHVKNNSPEPLRTTVSVSGYQTSWAVNGFDMWGQNVYDKHVLNLNLVG